VEFGCEGGHARPSSTPPIALDLGVALYKVAAGVVKGESTPYGRR
jgi:hypothetical protein